MRRARRPWPFTLPEQIEAGHVDFARQLAAKAWAYAVAVERRYRGLPPLPDTPVPYTLTAQDEARWMRAGRADLELLHSVGSCRLTVTP